LEQLPGVLHVGGTEASKSARSSAAIGRFTSVRARPRALRSEPNYRDASASAAGSGEDIVVHIKAHAIMRRKELGVAKTRGANLRWDKSVGFLVGGRSDGVNRMQAFARTAGTSVVTFLQGQQ